jgi:hypothetical protein
MLADCYRDNTAWKTAAVLPPSAADAASSAAGLPQPAKFASIA